MVHRSRFVAVLCCLQVVLLLSCSKNNEVQEEETSSATALNPILRTYDPVMLASPYGPRLLGGSYDFHSGVDMAHPTGTPVHAILDGKVVRAETAQPGSTLERYGQFVVISHDPFDEVELHQTVYLHLSETLVKVGDEIKQGDVIGKVGNTGVNINTEHLHFEYHIGENSGAIRRSNARHPLRILPYQSKSAVVDISKTNNELTITVVQVKSSMDLVSITISPMGHESKRIDFETLEGINKENVDVVPYQGIDIIPSPFNSVSSQMVLTFKVEGVWTDLEGVAVKLVNAKGKAQEFIHKFQ
ncbi:M23 family metallopeptidase [Flagellimonas sp.]|uniref:M23 family metallopeptidase n=1 Tax=Flagellimonas sp. TaxID=2058762 RepID=UPI003BADBC3A